MILYVINATAHHREDPGLAFSWVVATAGLPEELAQMEERAAREDAERDMNVGQANELESHAGRML